MENPVSKIDNNITPVMISRQNVPKYFPGLAPQTLANWKWKGIGPRAYCVGGKTVFYRLDELTSYMEGKRHAKRN